MNTPSEYKYFYISKNVTSYTFLLVFKIVESLQCINSLKRTALIQIFYRNFVNTEYGHFSHRANLSIVLMKAVCCVFKSEAINKTRCGEIMTVVETKLSVKKQQSKNYLLDTEEKRILKYQVSTADTL